MKVLLLCLLALIVADWYIRQPSKPTAQMRGEGRDYLSLCRNGGAA